MCLILFSVNEHPDYKLIVAANRDEFYDRPTQRVHWQDSYPQILAGKDLKAGGTWMGITKTGRFAALTNYRNPADMKHDMKSRGRLVSSYLLENISPQECAHTLSLSAEEYNGYNMLFGSADKLYHYSNKSLELTEIKSGVQGLSNHLLNTPWPKVTKGVKLFTEITKGSFSTDDIFEMLRNDTRAEDASLPCTGVSLEMERMLSPMFIKSPEYGTRSSALLTVSRDGEVIFTERAYGSRETDGDRQFRFQI